MKNKILAMLAVAIAAVMLVGCSVTVNTGKDETTESSTAASEQENSQTAETTSETEASEESDNTGTEGVPVSAQYPSSGALLSGNIDLSIGACTVIEDKNGAYVLRVDYDVTNHMKEAVSPKDLELTDLCFTAYQSGQELEDISISSLMSVPGISVDGSEPEEKSTDATSQQYYDNFYEEIQPGATLTFARFYPIRNTEDDVIAQVEEGFSAYSYSEEQNPIAYEKQTLQKQFQW
ncbi:DUF5067 domain-containing protein [Butyricicoccus sp.]|uniref:DUF5067 domain-containing protein n=1 Tax=Butyricicoccus sp. TaxID=2049021 RepID=UPI003F176C42